MGYTDIKQGDLVDTYARSSFEDTRRKAKKFGAMGSTILATKPSRQLTLKGSDEGWRATAE